MLCNGLNCIPPELCIKALIPNVLWENEASEEVIMVKCSYKGVPGLTGSVSLRRKKTPERSLALSLP